jgi:hypothetical protein
MVAEHPRRLQRLTLLRRNLRYRERLPRLLLKQVFRPLWLRSLRDLVERQRRIE